jgi:hypothetical protein
LLSILKKYCPDTILVLMRFLKNTFFTKNSVNLNRINFNNYNDKLIVMGNGPSIDNDIDKIISFSKNHDFFCVNNFACSKYFKILKPTKYIFLDDYFFSKKSHKDWIIQRTKTFNKINSDTTDWKIQLFIPSNADINIFKKHITNDNIELVKFNVTGIVSKFRKVEHMLFNSGFFGPFQGNVLIYAIYFGIWAKYKEIKIFGADLSLQENIKVDQNSNEMFMEFKHLGNQISYEKFMKNPEKIHPFNMSEFLLLSHKTFQAHEKLSIYSKENNIIIENHSNYSLIDAYKRYNNEI